MNKAFIFFLGALALFVPTMSQASISQVKQHGLTKTMAGIILAKNGADNPAGDDHGGGKAGGGSGRGGHDDGANHH